MKPIFEELIKEWFERELPEIKEREINLEKYINWKVKKIIPIIGFRRVGKTFLLFSLAKKVGKENTIYINFEDERIPRKGLSFQDFYQALKEIAGEKKVILLLDEIQEIPNWNRWLRTLNDISNYFIFVSGSSSKLSSKEIPTELRGRTLTINLYPLSFKEFLSFKGKDPEKIPKSSILKELKEYLKFGGLPEVVLSEEGKKYLLLDEYFSTFITRDVFERYNIKNKEVMRALIRILFNSTYITISRLHKTLKSLNLRIGKNTLANYLFYLSQTFLIDFVEIISPSIKNTLQAPRKVYFVDNFLISKYSSKFSENYGRLMENVVFLELKRRQNKNPLLEIFYWKDYQQKEVDFVIKEGLKVKQLIQVCYDISDIETKERESKALVKASDLLKCKNLLCITWDYEGEEKFKNKRIKFIPLWKWLLKV